MHQTYVAIMAGGIGSRFWPLSRAARPKQFIDVLGTGKTLLQSTYERFLQLVPSECILVVTNADYVDLVHEQLPALAPHQVLAEPMRRNTAPCIAYAANAVARQHHLSGGIVLFQGDQGLRQLPNPLRQRAIPRFAQPIGEQDRAG